MSKKSYFQSMSYREKLINSIAPNFIFSKKPLNEYKYDEIKNNNKSLNKHEQINDIKKLIE